MEPSPSALHIDAALTEYSYLAQQQESDFIAMKVCPPYPVAKLTGKIWEFAERDMFYAHTAKEGPDGYLPQIAFKPSTISYACERRGLESFILDKAQENADDAVKPDQQSIRILTRSNLIGLEKNVMDVLTSTANLTQNTTLTAGNQFNDSGSDPDSTFKTARQACIIPPNTAFMNEQVYDQLRIHAQAKEMVKYTQSGPVPESLLAAWMGVQRIFVSRAKYKTTDEASATNTLGYVMGKDIVFAYIADSPMQGSATLAWTFWYRDMFGAPGSFVVRTDRDNRRGGGGNYYFCEAWYDEAVIMSASVAYLIKSAIA